MQLSGPSALTYPEAVVTPGPSLFITGDSFNHSLMPPLMERSIEESSLPGLSHQTTPSLSSSALSSPLNDTELISSLDSDRLLPSGVSLSGGVPTTMPSGCMGLLGSTPFHAAFFGSAAPYNSPLDWLPINPNLREMPSRPETVTYDDVAS
ncbi:unnamed protein product [Echinostoma caproni]|uniref:TORC_C domain-containing protein n=1 Tax=Echinostoma caproni TaxID=27848 RepID=A0A183ANS6_9TREM|nr:unnamed protein product [Echinostoma caproni]